MVPLCVREKKSMGKSIPSADKSRQMFGQFPVHTDDLLHVMEADLPWVPLDDVGSQYQIPIADLNTGMYVSNVRLQPGARFETHYHTGMVLGITRKGAWFYLEQPDTRNVPGSFLVEPASSLHTLTVPEDQEFPTEASFILQGANINLDHNARVISVVDAGIAVNAYRRACEKLGESCEPMIVIGR